MENILLKSSGKINLTLDILGKRNDGYHELKTIMQTLELHDNVFMEKIKSRKILISSNIPHLPTNQNNIVYKAVETIMDKYPIKGGVCIYIKKSIPIAAGLAGGSGNCAVALLGMRELFNLFIPFHKLMEIGKSLGSDVPFCLVRGTALAEGIGHKIKSLPSHPKVYVLLVTPDVRVSTKDIFNKLDKNSFLKTPKTNAMLNSIYKRDLYGISKNLSNQLEDITSNKYPIINDIKKSMINNNALGSVMSGSGPTVFGYYTNKTDAYLAMKYFKDNFKKIRYTTVTRVFNPKKVIKKRNDNNVRGF